MDRILDRRRHQTKMASASGCWLPATSGDSCSYWDPLGEIVGVGISRVSRRVEPSRKDALMRFAYVNFLLRRTR